MATKAKRTASPARYPEKKWGPFHGGTGLAVLFAKPFLGISEVVNDLCGDLMNFWRTLQDKEVFAQFKRRIEAVPFSEAEWQDAQSALEQHQVPRTQVDRLERAVRFFILSRQSMAGRCKDFTPLTGTRTRRGMNAQVSAWLNAVQGLTAVHARLQRVVILNRPALEVIRSQDGPDTLFYLDPPYLPETRSSPAVFGELDMTQQQHEELLDVLPRLVGKVMHLCHQAQRLGQVIHHPGIYVLHHGRASSRANHAFAATHIAVGFVKYLRRTGNGRLSLFLNKLAITLDTPLQLAVRSGEYLWRRLRRQPGRATKTLNYLRGHWAFLCRGMGKFWRA